MNLEDEKMDFPSFSKKKNFEGWHMKISQGVVLVKKIFFVYEMNLEDEKMDFPLFLKKKIFLRLLHKNS